jgi:hypothetical protein
MVLANENLVPTMSSAAMTAYKPSEDSRGSRIASG